MPHMPVKCCWLHFREGHACFNAIVTCQEETCTSVPRCRPHWHAHARMHRHTSACLWALKLGSIWAKVISRQLLGSPSKSIQWIAPPDPLGKVTLWACVRVLNAEDTGKESELTAQRNKFLFTLLLFSLLSTQDSPDDLTSSDSFSWRR